MRGMWQQDWGNGEFEIMQKEMLVALSKVQTVKQTHKNKIDELFLRPRRGSKRASRG